MPNLDSICGIINTALQADQFGTRRFQASAWYNIADPLRTTGENETTQPVIIDNEGEGKSVVFDDTNALQVFHRINSISYKIADPDYGNPGTTTEETANMRMIFVGSRRRLKTRPENVMAGAAMDFPKELNSSVITSLGMNSLIIEMGDIDLDPYSVWNTEWQGSDFELDSDTFLFSLKYTIISTFNKSCFSICP